MSFMDMVYQRESCRSYQDKPVSRELLTKMVEAGRLAPSGCNAQPWKFLVIDEPEAKKEDVRSTRCRGRRNRMPVERFRTGIYRTG